MGKRPCNYFRWCGYLWGPWVSFITADEFSVRVTKITSMIGVSWTHSLPFYFLPLFWLSGMAILSKARKPDNFQLHNSLKLNFTNTRRLYSNFVERKSFLESSPPDILVLWDKFGCWMTQSILQFLCEGLSSFNPKGFCYSHTWPCSLCKGGCWGCGGSFCTGLFPENSADSYCFRLALLLSVSYFFSLWTPSSSLSSFCCYII